MLDGRVQDLPEVPGARVWRSRIGADGLMDLESLSGHEADDRTRLIRLQRALYRRYLDGELMAHAADAADAAALAGLSPEAAQAILGRLDEASGLMTLLASQGALLARTPLPAMKNKFLATWQRVQVTLEAEPRLAVLSALWLFESERPGLDLGGILALAERFAGLLTAMRRSVGFGT